MKWAYDTFYWASRRRNVGTNFKIMYTQILVGWGDRRKLASVRPPARFSHSQWEEVCERERVYGMELETIPLILVWVTSWKAGTDRPPSRGSAEVMNNWNTATSHTPRIWCAFVIILDSRTRYKRIARQICNLAGSFELLGYKRTVTTYWCPCA